MGMNWAAGVECLVQLPMEKITGTLIPDRDTNYTKRNCQRGVESLETCDGKIMKAVGLQQRRGAPMKWKSPGPSRGNETNQL